MIGAALEAEDDLRVHQVAVLAEVAADIMRVAAARSLSALLRKPPSLLLDLAHESVVLDVAGRDDDHALGAVLPLDEGVELLRGEGLHRFGRAEDRAADRLVAEGRLGEAVEDDVVGRVVRGADLLQDDVLLALEFVGVEFRSPVRMSARMSTASGTSSLSTRA